MKNRKSIVGFPAMGAAIVSQSFNKLSLFGSMILLVYALALFFQIQFAADLWVWPKSPELGLAFAGAWMAGGLFPLIWSGLRGQFAPLRSLALAGIAASGGSAVLLISKHTVAGNERYLPFGLLFLMAFLVIIYIFIKSRQVPASGDNAVSPVIRWVFLLFTCLLLYFGIALLMDTPNIFPIALSTDMGAMYGCFFLGSSAYYFYGFLKPTRFWTVGPMLSFLVYDLLLIPPYVKYAAVVPAQFQTSLAIYLSVLISSALFCGFYLFVDPRSRLFK